MLVIAALLLAAGCTTVHRLDSTKCQVIPVPQGLQNPSVCESMCAQIARGESVILKVAEGERMPLKLAVDLPMGTLEEAENTFVFKHDTYFLLAENKFCLSPDGQRWANVSSPRSVAKLFGAKHGVVSFGFTSKTNEPPYMSIDVKMKSLPPGNGANSVAPPAVSLQ